MKPKELSKGDMIVMKYFWEDKRDIETYCYFEDLKAQIKDKEPKLLDLWNKYKYAIKDLDDYFKQIEV